MTNKRNRSPSPAHARKRSSPTMSTSGPTSSQKIISNNTAERKNPLNSTPDPSAHSSRSRSMEFESTTSPHVGDTSSTISPAHLQPPCPSNASASKIPTISTPPAVSTYAGMITPGPLTPQSQCEPSHDGTVVSPYVANNFQYPTSTSLMNYAPTESFPVFKTGDVFIKTELVTPPKQWQLHSNILARFSSWFSRSLTTDPFSMKGQTWASYTIEEIDGKILLVQQQSTGERPIIQNTGGNTIADVRIKIEHEDEGSDISFSITPDHTTSTDIYSQIFSAFYNIPLHLPTANIAASLTHSEQLTKLASDLGCLENLPNLTSQINAILLQHRHPLLRAIKNDPAHWPLLSLSFHNESIYTEALIHMSGAHPCWIWPTPRSSLPEEIIRLITTKSQELDRRCVEVERDLLLLLTINVGRNANSHPVSLLTNSEFDTWFIVSTFRSILAKEFTALDNDRKGSLRRGNIYRKIRKGEGYMPYEDMRRMMEQVMPSAVPNLSEDLAMLKRWASEYVEDLAKSGEGGYSLEGWGEGVRCKKEAHVPCQQTS